jgi:methylase of polypeptide subunit release factors
MPWNHDTAESYDELGQQSHEPLVRRLIRELSLDVEDRRVLDFGCGPGNLALALAGPVRARSWAWTRAGR